MNLNSMKCTEKKSIESNQHEQTLKAQKLFASDVNKLISTIEDMGNPFLEQTDLNDLHNKDVANTEVQRSVQTVKQIGIEQYQLFVEERIQTREKTIYDRIPKNQLVLFNSQQKSKIVNSNICVFQMPCM